MRNLLIFAFVSSASLGISQTWTETDHHYHDKHWHMAQEMYVWSGPYNFQDLQATFYGYFKVTGSTESGPAWRMPFASLCDNSLPVSESFSGFVGEHQELVNFCDWYLRGPHENVDECGDSGHSSSCGYSQNVNSFTDGEPNDL